MTCDLPAIEVTGDVVNLFVARRSRTTIKKKKKKKKKKKTKKKRKKRMWTRERLREVARRCNMEIVEHVRTRLNETRTRHL